MSWQEKSRRLYRIRAGGGNRSPDGRRGFWLLYTADTRLFLPPGRDEPVPGIVSGFIPHHFQYRRVRHRNRYGHDGLAGGSREFYPLRCNGVGHSIVNHKLYEVPRGFLIVVQPYWVACGFRFGKK